ncbi:MAG: hypothetical protein ACT4NV_07835 [Rhodoferax sp.]
MHPQHGTTETSFTDTQLAGILAGMKTTLDLPDELVREMKLRAVMQGRTLRDLAAEFIRAGLGLAAPRAPVLPPSDSMVSLGPNGLPVVRCRVGAPAERMSAEDLMKLEQDSQTDEDAHRAGLSV